MFTSAILKALAFSNALRQDVLAIAFPPASTIRHQLMLSLFSEVLVNRLIDMSTIIIKGELLHVHIHIHIFPITSISDVETDIHIDIHIDIDIPLLFSFFFCVSFLFNLHDLNLIVLTSLIPPSFEISIHTFLEISNQSFQVSFFEFILLH